MYKMIFVTWGSCVVCHIILFSDLYPREAIISEPNVSVFYKCVKSKFLYGLARFSKQILYVGLKLLETCINVIIIFNLQSLAGFY